MQLGLDVTDKHTEGSFIYYSAKITGFLLIQNSGFGDTYFVHSNHFLMSKYRYKSLFEYVRTISVKKQVNELKPIICFTETKHSKIVNK